VQSLKLRNDFDSKKFCLVKVIKKIKMLNAETTLSQNLQLFARMIAGTFSPTFVNQIICF